MASKTDLIKEKLRKILAVVRSNGNVHEREQAMLRLQELLVKHRLEMTDIEHKEEEGIIRLEVQGRNGPWARTVGHAIAKLNFCSYLFQRNNGDQRNCIHIFIGRPHEVEVVKELTLLILEQLNTESTVQARRSLNKSFQRSFLNGALMVLSEYTRAENENKTFLEVAYPKAKSDKRGQQKKSKSYAGMAEGAVFGNKIPLNLSKMLS
jgi:Protein of unknown function (DUF2786)